MPFSGSDRVLEAWPTLAVGSGAELLDNFREFASERSVTVAVTPLAEGRLFAAHLARKHRLSDLARIQMMSFDLHHQFDGFKAKQRKRLALRIAYVHSLPGIIMGLFIPTLGVRRFVVAIPRTGFRNLWKYSEKQSVSVEAQPSSSVH